MKKITFLYLFFVLTGITCYSQTEQHLWNRDFYNGVDKAWGFQVNTNENDNHPPKAKIDVYQKDDNKGTNCAKIRVISTSRSKKAHEINLYQKLFDMKKSRKYKVTYMIKSNIGRKDEVFVQILSSKFTGSKLPFAVYYSKKMEFKGDGGWKKMSFEFETAPAKGSKSEKADVENMILRFGFGSRMGVYYLDTVRVKRI